MVFVFALFVKLNSTPPPAVLFNTGLKYPAFSSVSKLAGYAVDVPILTSVNPTTEVDVSPNAIEVVPIVIVSLVNAEFGRLVNVLSLPSIDLLVSVCVSVNVATIAVSISRVTGSDPSKLPPIGDKPFPKSRGLGDANAIDPD